MNGIVPNTPTAEPMSDDEFMRFSIFIYKRCGIKLAPSKKTMLEARLQKRLKHLCIKSYSEYADYVFSPEGLGSELVHMIDVVTTNKTDFFREPACYEYLTRTALPELAGKHGSGVQRSLRIWSAGCSSGEEPYTLAMVLSEHAAGCLEYRFSVLATDISTRMLQIAAHAVYKKESVEPLPAELRIKYCMMSRDKERSEVRIVPELRSLVKFRRLNFMDSDFKVTEPMDVIFCRNVIIYFDRPTQEKLLNRFCEHLMPGGYVFVGHSEVLTNMDIPLSRVSQSVYKKI